MIGRARSQFFGPFFYLEPKEGFFSRTLDIQNDLNYCTGVI